MAGVYLFLYITSRQQDYALLTGAIALFVVLAMYVARKVDWYARDAGYIIKDRVLENRVVYQTDTPQRKK